MQPTTINPENSLSASTDLCRFFQYVDLILLYFFFFLVHTMLFKVYIYIDDCMCVCIFIFSYSTMHARTFTNIPISIGCVFWTLFYTILGCLFDQIRCILTKCHLLRFKCLPPLFFEKLISRNLYSLLVIKY